jgi:hypothetical protein
MLKRTEKKCVLCPKTCRSDVVGRHMITHRKDIIQKMTPEARRAIRQTKKPIMYGGDKQKCEAYAVCLCCNRCVTDVSQFEITKFVHNHSTLKCMNSWPDWAALFDDGPPSPPETAIQNVVTYAAPLPVTRYEKSANCLSDSTAENLLAWGRARDEPDDVTLDDLVTSLIDSETYSVEKLEALDLNRLYDVGRLYGESYDTHAEALEGLLEKVRDLQRQLDSRHM